jgi:serine/threonine protein kinase
VPPGAPRTTQGAPAAGLTVGDLLCDRYELLATVATDGPAVLWRAHDDVLARQVAVKVIATPNKAAREAAQPFLDAAIRTGAVNHPGLVRVYDAALEVRPGRGNDIAYVISEWVEGEALDTHLNRVGPLAAPDAADVLRQAADALSAAHAGGLLHGRVHPRNVLVTPSGRVRLTDAAVAAAVHGSPTSSPPLQADLPSRIADDTRDLAAVLYALTTGRWPAGASDQPPGGLPTAPLTDGHPLSPRQLKAGVPRALDNVVMRGLEPQLHPTQPRLTRPAALAEAADTAAAEARAARIESAVVKPPSRLRRSLPWLAALVFLGAIGIGGWLLGLAVGDLPRRPNGVDALVTTTSAPKPGASVAPVLTALDLTRVAIRDFDPLGDKQEDPDQVRNAVDGVPSTAWATSLYRSAHFGGLKPGVGLVLDLGRVVDLHAVTVGFSAPGAHLELQVAEVPPVDVTSVRTVATANDGALVATLTPAAGTRSRYVVLWITQLPQDGTGYRVGISEVRIT